MKTRKLVVGDKVVRIQNPLHDCSNYNSQVAYAIITYIDDDVLQYDLYDKSGDYIRDCSCLRAEDFRLYNPKLDEKKENPIKYVVTYDISSRDPVQKFCNYSEVLEFLDKAVNDRDIKFKTIRVYEVVKELQVKTNFKLV